MPTIRGYDTSGGNKLIFGKAKENISEAYKNREAEISNRYSQSISNLYSNDEKKMAFLKAQALERKKNKEKRNYVRENLGVNEMDRERERMNALRVYSQRPTKVLTRDDWIATMEKSDPKLKEVMGRRISNPILSIEESRNQFKRESQKMNAHYENYYNSMRAMGYSEKEIGFRIEREFDKKVAIERDSQIVKDKLKDIESKLKSGKEDFLYGIKEASLKSEVENMLSNEKQKFALGKPNNVEVINDWLSEHPELQWSGEEDLAVRVAGGLSGFTTDMKNRLLDPLEAQDLLTFAGSVVVGGITLATGPLGLLAQAGTVTGAMSMKMLTETVTDMMANTYYDSKQAGLSDDSARIAALTTGTLNGLLEHFSAGIMMKIPMFKGFVNKASQEASRNVAKLVAQRAMAYGKDIAIEVGQEVFEEASTNSAIHLLKANEMGIDPLVYFKDNVWNKPEETFDYYTTLMKETFFSVALVPLIGEVNTQARNSFENISKKQKDAVGFIKSDNTKKYVDMINSDDITPSQKAEAMLTVEQGATIFEDLDKVSGISPEDKKAVQEVFDKGRENINKELAKDKAKDKSIEFMQRDRSAILDKLVDNVKKGAKIDTDFTLLNQNLTNAVMDNYIEADKVNGFVDKVREFKLQGVEDVKIAEQTYKMLPRKNRTRIKASEYINAIDAVDYEVKLQSNYAGIENIKKHMEVNNIKINNEPPTSVELRKDVYDAKHDIENKVKVKEEPKADAYKNMTVDSKNVKAEPKADIYMLKTNDVAVDPERFQFRANGTDPEKFKNTPYDPDLAGIYTVYEENGNYYAIDGHHRLEIAKANGVESIPARIIRADEMNVKEARLLGARKNIAEDHASAIDVATLIKDNNLTKEDLKNFNIRPNSKIYKDGIALRDLNEDIYNNVILNALSEEKGAEIARAFPDSKRNQMTLYKAIRAMESRGKIVYASDIRYMASLIGTDIEAQGGTQIDLFGDNDREDLYSQKLEILKYFDTNTKNRKNILKAVSREKNTNILSANGNIIDIEANMSSASDYEILTNSINNAVWAGNKYVTDILNDTALQLKQDPNNVNIKKKFIDDMAQLVNDGAVDFRGLSPDDYKEMSKTASYKLKKKDLLDPSALLNENYTGNGVFTYDGDIPETIRKHLKDNPRMTIFSDKNVNSNHRNELVGSIDSLKNTDYFKDTSFIFEGKNEYKKFSVEQLKELGYSLPEGEYELNGYAIHNDGLNEIHLSNNSDKATVFEEVIHTIYNKEKSLNSDLSKEITAWEEQYGTDNEIYSKTLTEQFAQAVYDDLSGIDKTLPDGLRNSIKGILGDDFIDITMNDKNPDGIKHNKLSSDEFDLRRGKYTEKKDKIRAKHNVNINSKIFKDWFGNSKIKDDYGKPLVLYETPFLSDEMCTYCDTKKAGATEVYMSADKIKDVKNIEKINNFNEFCKTTADEGFEALKFDRNGEIHYFPLVEDLVINAYDNGDLHLRRLQKDVDFLKSISNSDKEPSAIAKDIEFRVGKEIADEYLNDPSKFRDGLNMSKTREAAEKYINELGFKEACALYAQGQLPIDYEDSIKASYQVAIVRQLHAMALDMGDSYKTEARILGQRINNINQITGQGMNLAKMFKDDVRGLKEQLIEQINSDADIKADERYTSEAKEVKRQFRKIDKDSIDTADFQGILTEYISEGDSVHTMREIGKVAKTEGFDKYVSDLSEATGKSTDEIFAYGLTDEEYSRVENIGGFEEVLRRATEQSTTIDDTVLKEKSKSIENATRSYVDGKSATLEDALVNNGFNEMEASQISSKVKNQMAKNTAEKKIETLRTRKNKVDPEKVLQLTFFEDTFDSEETEELVKGALRQLDDKNGYSPQLKRVLESYAEKVVNAKSEDEQMRFISLFLDDIGKYVQFGKHNTFSNARAVAMLANPSTHVGNVLSTALSSGLEKASRTSGLIVDSILSQFTGYKSMEARNPIHTGKLWFGGFVDGFKKGKQEVDLGVRSGDAVNKYDDVKSGKSFVFNVENDDGEMRSYRSARRFNNDTIGDIFNKISKIESYGLYAVDKAFTGAEMAVNRDEIGRVVEKHYADKGLNVPKSVNQKIDAFVTAEALTVTFNNNSKASQVASRIRSVANHIKLPFMKMGLGDIQAPFAKTHSNMAATVYHHSFGAIPDVVSAIGDFRTADADVDKIFAQRKIATSVGRGLTGVAIAGAGALLGSAGVITPFGDGKDDSRDEKSERSKGLLRGGFNVSLFKRYAGNILFGADESLELQDGDYIIDFNFLAPYSHLANWGARVAESLKDTDIDPVEAVYAIFDAGKIEVEEIANIGNFQDIFSDKYGADVTDNIISSFAGLPASFIFNPVRATANLTDPYQRDIYDDNKLIEAKNKVMAAIPGLKQQLPLNVDNYGNPIEYGKGQSALLRGLDTYILPGYISRYTGTDFTKRLDEIYKATGNKEIYPSTMDNRFEIDDGKIIELPKEEFAYLQMARGETIKQMYDEILNYGSGDSEEVAKQIQKELKNINGQVKEFAVQIYLMSEGE